jgi:CRP-like cAMP-binding protein
MAELDASPLIRKLKRFFQLTDLEDDALLSLPLRIAEYGADVELIREGDRPTECNLLLVGFVCRSNTLADGKRQIVAFHIPGDVFDTQSFLLERMDHTISTLTTCKIAAIAHTALFKLFENQPRVGMAIWKDTLVDASMFRQWVTNVGRRDAHARTAHLMCEMFLRCAAVGLNRANTVDWPLTQGELADALGMSHVHVNRTLRDLRQSGLISIDRQQLTVHDWAKLKAAANFDPAYLHLDETAIGSGSFTP